MVDFNSESPAGSGAVAKPTAKTPKIGKNKAGRPTKLTPELLIEMERCFRLGMNHRRVCDRLLISEGVFYHWVRQAKADDEQGKTNSPYLKFLITIQRAQAEFDDKHLEKIGDDPDWRARAWLLERNRPEQFAPKETQRTSDEVDRPREGAIVVAKVVNPLHELLDKAKVQGSDTLMVLLAELTGKNLVHTEIDPHETLDIKELVGDTKDHDK